LFGCSAAASGQCIPEWSAIGALGGAAPAVHSLAVWDPDSAGPAHPVLVAGGVFESAGGAPTPNLAAWDGSGRSPLGGGIGGRVNALAALPDGRLVAAGSFSTAGGAPAANIAIWDGASWSSPGSGLNGDAYALKVAAGGDLIVGGLFTTAGGAS